MQPKASQPPAVLDYGVEPASPLLTPFRITAFAALAVWGYYIAVMFRCWDAGFRLPTTLLLTAIYVTPMALVVFLGLPWQRHIMVLLMLIVLPALIAEAHATLEEQLFLASVKNLPKSSAVVFKPQRWWPNRSSFLYYDPATGQLGGGD